MIDQPDLLPHNPQRRCDPAGSRGQGWPLYWWSRSGREVERERPFYPRQWLQHVWVINTQGTSGFPWPKERIKLQLQSELPYPERDPPSPSIEWEKGWCLTQAHLRASSENPMSEVDSMLDASHGTPPMRCIKKIPLIIKEGETGAELSQIKMLALHIISTDESLSSSALIPRM